MSLRVMSTDVLAVALGRGHRVDAVAPGTGGPAGNARLTAWTGLLLLVLSLAELITLLDVRGLISWHIGIGVLLVPPALLKTGSTGWRIVRYYTGQRTYVEAGPPPLLLRLLGPLVVIFTLAVLVSGVVLALIGPDNSRHVLANIFGQRIDGVTLHQAAFAAWAVVTGLHVLTRLVPALQLTVLPGGKGDHVPGPRRRGIALALTLAVAAASAALVLGLSTDWRSEQGRDHELTPAPGEAQRNFV
jgi:hypothetical protein